MTTSGIVNTTTGTIPQNYTYASWPFETCPRCGVVYNMERAHLCGNTSIWVKAIVTTWKPLAYRWDPLVHEWTTYQPEA